VVTSVASDAQGWLVGAVIRSIIADG